MFCPKCGTELSDDSRFCLACGSPIKMDKNVSGGLQLKPDIGTIIVIVISVIMLLSLVCFPMFNLVKKEIWGQIDGEMSDSREVFNCSVSLLGDRDNSVIDEEITNELDKIAFFSRVWFVFLGLFTVAGMIFKYVRKNSLGAICSVINLAVLVGYYLCADGTWGKTLTSIDSSTGSFRGFSDVVTVNVGYIVCVIGSNLLLILFLVELINDRKHIRAVNQPQSA